MADNTRKNKNKPGFFAVLITLVFIAASVFGVHKIMTYVESDPSPIVGTSTPEGITESFSGTSDTGSEAENNKLGVILDEITGLNHDIPEDVINYCAEVCEVSQLEAVLNALKDKTYTTDTWYTATGISYNALLDLSSGAVNDGLVRDMGSNGTDSIELAFAGDVCFDESIPNMQKYAETSKLSDCISQELLDIMTGADIMLVNNEFTFTTSEDAQNKKYTFKSSPENAILYKEMGVDVVSLANNHSFDFGEQSYTDTVETLIESEISYMGAGKNIDEAAKPAYFIANGQKIAYIAVCDTTFAKSTAATSSSSGVFSIRNFDAVINAIKEADKVSDYVIVYAHWGHENSNWFSSDPAVSDQAGWGRDFIDAGADAVVGSHPHVLQGMEYHDGKIIAYSLGNFWFNGKTMDTGILRLKIAKDGQMQCIFEPCIQTGGTVSLVSEEAKRNEVFSLLSQHSGGFITIDDDGVITAVKDTKGM